MYVHCVSFAVVSVMCSSPVKTSYRWNLMLQMEPVSIISFDFNILLKYSTFTCYERKFFRWFFLLFNKWIKKYCCYQITGKIPKSSYYLLLILVIFWRNIRLIKKMSADGKWMSFFVVALSLFLFFKIRFWFQHHEVFCKLTSLYCWYQHINIPYP